MVWVVLNQRDNFEREPMVSALQSGKSLPASVANDDFRADYPPRPSADNLVFPKNSVRLRGRIHEYC
jgi:hypothetical protein